MWLCKMYFAFISTLLFSNKSSLDQFVTCCWARNWKKISSRNVSICLFVCNRGDTIQYHGGLDKGSIGQAPMLLVSLTPRQALSSHPRQQMVWLYWLQDRDSMPNWYTINHPTTLHTQNYLWWTKNAKQNWNISWGLLAPSIFDRPANPITTRVADSALPLLLAHSNFFTFRHPRMRSNIFFVCLSTTLLSCIQVSIFFIATRSLETFLHLFCWE